MSHLNGGQQVQLNSGCNTTINSALVYEPDKPFRKIEEKFVAALED